MMCAWMRLLLLTVPGSGIVGCGVSAAYEDRHSDKDLGMTPTREHRASHEMTVRLHRTSPESNLAGALGFDDVEYVMTCGSNRSETGKWRVSPGVLSVPAEETACTLKIIAFAIDGAAYRQQPVATGDTPAVLYVTADGHSAEGRSETPQPFTPAPGAELVFTISQAVNGGARPAGADMDPVPVTQSGAPAPQIDLIEAVTLPGTDNLQMTLECAADLKTAPILQCAGEDLASLDVAVGPPIISVTPASLKSRHAAAGRPFPLLKPSVVPESGRRVRIEWEKAPPGDALISFKSGDSYRHFRVSEAVAGKGAALPRPAPSGPDALAGSARAVWWVTPEAAASGAGTAADPMTLAKAITDGVSPARPGDLIWVRGGTYPMDFRSTLKGTATAPIHLAAYPGERATIDGHIPSSPQTATDFAIESDHVFYWRLEVTNSNPRSRRTSQTGPWPTDIQRGGFNIYSGNNRFINGVIHDVNNVGWWRQATGDLYGTIIYNIGWEGPDRRHGHALYTQNSSARKRIADNILFNPFMNGMDIYGSSATTLNDYLVEGNVIFNAGSGAGGDAAGGGSEMIIGGGAVAENIVVRNNVVYSQDNAAADLSYAFGQINKNMVVTGNYFASQVRIWHGVDAMEFTGNTLVQTEANSLIHLGTELPATAYRWDQNLYRTARADPFNFGGALSYGAWAAKTGFDQKSSLTQGNPDTNLTIVRPNLFENGRAHVIVFNWTNADTAVADLGAVLVPGESFSIHHVHDLFGAPVVQGQFLGKPVSIPMHARPGAMPAGGTLNGAPVGFKKEFAVFLVRKVATAASKSGT